MAIRFLFPALLLLLVSCGGETTSVNADDSAFMDSMINAKLNDTNARIAASRDTVHHTALPPVFEGDIIMQNYKAKGAVLSHDLMGGKYNHVGIIFQRPKDGMLVVLDLTDSVRLTELTAYVDRADSGHVCILRIKESNKTLTEEKVTALRDAAKQYRGKPADPMLNWDDSRMYSSELVWKVYNNAMMLKLCPLRTVADFKIPAAKEKEVETEYGGDISSRDEAVSPDDIYNSKKLEVVYEK